MHLKRRWINRQIYEYFAVNLGPLLGWRDPILVYQMGRVGSSSIRNSLFRCRDPRTRLVLMSHEFFPIRNRDPELPAVDPGDREAVRREMAHDRQVFQQFPLRRKISWLWRKRFYRQRIHDAYVRRGDDLRVITLVRDPAAHNVSLFFQVFDQYAGTTIERSGYGVDDMIRLFLERCVHTRPLTWLDAELKATLGVDVYRQPFPVDRGHAVVSEGRVRVLVLRTELDDGAKAQAIARFLDLDRFELVRSNVTADKPHAELYAEFLRRVRLPDSLLDTLYDSKYARHFYSAEERERFRARWSGRPNGS
jgi:hypothetical protein